MFRTFYILFIISVLVGIFFGCQDQVEIIKPVNIEDYWLDPAKGITVKQQDSLHKEVSRVIRSNTLNHHLPAISLKDLAGKKGVLNKILGEEKVMLVFGAEFCAPCKISLFENFPLILDSLASANKDYQIVLIAVKTDSDYNSPEKFKEFLNDCKQVFKKVYIMEDSISKKLNLQGFPSQYYIENYLVKDFNIGAARDYKIRLKQMTEFFEEV